MMEDLKNWLNKQHAWLQEAAFRLLKNGKIENSDISEFIALIKSPATTPRIPKVFPSIGASAGNASVFRLNSIGNVQGIDNLSPRIPLDFGKGNFAVVYGNNGSGKSGYARILKKVSGKASAKDLKPNVFQPIPPQRQCNISYSVNGALQKVTWAANSSPIQDLIPLDIFDSSSGRFYLENENEVSYSPAELTLLTDLVRVCKQVEEALNAEQSTLVKTLPPCPTQYTQTTRGAEYSGISANTPSSKIQELKTWLPAHDARITELQGKLNLADPMAKAKELRDEKQQLDIMQARLTQTLRAYSQEAALIIIDLSENAKKARKIAIEAAQNLKDSTKLDGIGSVTWRAMWNAARNYSVSEAYLNHSFPHTSESAKCVLCHQTLDAEAIERLNTFDTYIKSTLERDAQNAEDAFIQAKQGLPQVPNEADIKTACAAAKLNATYSALIQDIWSRLEKIKLEWLSDSMKIQAFTATDLDISLQKDLANKSLVLETKAKELEQDAQTFDRSKARQELLALEALGWISQQSAQIDAEILRLKNIAQYIEWKKATSTTAITKKSGELSELLITSAYIKRFNDELIALGAKNLKVELAKTPPRLGRTRHRIQLKGLQQTGSSLSDILSEGESRIVALAAFLADVMGKQSQAPFLFDDPISSLDHEYEWSVATRLAELAKTRQVIVLTHRLSLYGFCEDAATKNGKEWEEKNLEKLCIESFAGSSGQPVLQSHWNSKAKKLNNLLIEDLNSARSDYNSGHSADYYQKAQSICSSFRKLIEKTIEEDLLSEIVLRHRRSLQTQNKIVNLAKISSTDCKYFDDLMTKYSCFEHSQSDETPATIPDEPELRQDIEGLKKWRDEFKNRVAA